jgi:hypothetical protein
VWDNVEKHRRAWPADQDSPLVQTAGIKSSNVSSWYKLRCVQHSSVHRYLCMSLYWLLPKPVNYGSFSGDQNVMFKQSQLSETVRGIATFQIAYELTRGVQYCHAIIWAGNCWRGRFCETDNLAKEYESFVTSVPCAWHGIVREMSEKLGSNT